MNRTEAQNILQLCHPDRIEDLNDPLITEALAWLERDVELKAWYASQQAFDRCISAGLNRVVAPVDLKHRILAGMRADPMQAQTAGSQVACRKPVAGWRNPWVRIAATLIFMAILLSRPLAIQPDVAAVPPAVPGVLQFLSDRIDELNSADFDQMSSQLAQLQRYLVHNGRPTPATIPHCLQQMSTLGCVTFDYGGTQLSMICFKDGKLYHLSTAAQQNFPDVLPERSQIYQVEDKAFKLWLDGEQVRIIGVEGVESDIPEFI